MIRLLPSLPLLAALIFPCFAQDTVSDTAARESAQVQQLPADDIRRDDWLQQFFNENEKDVKQYLQKKLRKATNNALARPPLFRPKPLRAESATPQTADSLADSQYQSNFADASIQKIRDQMPHLWSYLLYKNERKARNNIRKDTTLDRAAFRKYRNTEHYKHRFSLEVNALAFQSYNDLPRASRKLLDDSERAESLYVAEKNNLDVAQAKRVFSADRQNYALFHAVSDSALDGSYVGDRVALHWQISIKYPFVVWRHYDMGVYLGFTTTGCFDLSPNGELSNPVIKKSFQPGAFFRLDTEPGLRRICRWDGIDDEIDFGIYHHSNGGYTSLSRGMTYQFHITNRLKLFRRPENKKISTVYDEQYIFTLKTRVQTWGDENNMAENPGIDTLWGNWDIWCTAEHGFGPLINGILVWHLWADAHLSKSSYYVSFGAWPTIFSWRKRTPVRIPLAPYIRYYSGKNEFLEHYPERRRWFAWGLLLKR